MAQGAMFLICKLVFALVEPLPIIKGVLMIRSLIAFALTTGLATSALAMDKAYFQIKDVVVTEVTDQYPTMQPMAQAGLAEDCSTQRPLKILRTGDQLMSANPLDVIELVVDQVINIGKKMFAVVQEGRSVVNVNLDTANALPKGLTCWSDLSGWNVPQSKVYNVQYVNGFDIVVVDFSYRVTFTAGGSADGVGQYITNATIMPANLSVAWGFNFDANAAIPSVFNTGSKQEPVAGMQMNMAWKVTNAFSHEQATETFFLSGDNMMKKLD